MREGNKESLVYTVQFSNAPPNLRCKILGHSEAIVDLERCSVHAVLGTRDNMYM